MYAVSQLLKNFPGQYILHLFAPRWSLEFVFTFIFYRAMLCVARYVTVSRCPSVTLAYCIQTAEDIITPFLGPVAPSFYFLSPSAVTQFQRKFTLRGVK